MEKEKIKILEAYGNGKVGTIYERGYLKHQKTISSRTAAMTSFGMLIPNPKTTPF